MEFLAHHGRSDNRAAFLQRPLKVIALGIGRADAPRCNWQRCGCHALDIRDKNTTTEQGQKFRHLLQFLLHRVTCTRAHQDAGHLTKGEQTLANFVFNFMTHQCSHGCLLVHDLLFQAGADNPGNVKRQGPQTHQKNGQCQQGDARPERTQDCVIPDKSEHAHSFCIIEARGTTFSSHTQRLPQIDCAAGAF